MSPLSAHNLRSLRTQRRSRPSWEITVPPTRLSRSCRMKRKSYAEDSDDEDDSSVKRLKLIDLCSDTEDEIESTTAGIVTPPSTVAADRSEDMEGSKAGTMFKWLPLEVREINSPFVNPEVGQVKC